MNIMGINGERSVEIRIDGTSNSYVKIAGEKVPNVASAKIEMHSHTMVPTATIQLVGADAENFLKLRQVKFEVIK